MLKIVILSFLFLLATFMSKAQYVKVRQDFPVRSAIVTPHSEEPFGLGQNGSGMIKNISVYLGGW